MRDITGPADSSRDLEDRSGDATRPGSIRILVLGPLVVEYDGRELHVAGSHRRRLLAFLASRGGRVAGLDAIADALWGDDVPPTTAKSIQNHVARLRRSLAAVDRELIETTAGGYRLAVEPEAIDAVAFERSAVEGRRRLTAGDAAGAASVLEPALALWRGPAYGELAGAEFAVGESVRLHELRWAAMEDVAEARLDGGAFEVVTADLERLVAEQPGRERAWGLLIRALYGAGRQRDALAAYQRARRALADEFGLEPGPELRALERRVLEQDPSLTVRRSAPVPAPLRRPPGPFVGRQRELAWLVDGWRAARGGCGQLRMLLGPVESGRTRLAGELAAVAVADGGEVVYVRAEEGFEGASGLGVATGSPAGAIVDVVTERSRGGPLVVVVDDAEWSSAPTMTAVTALAAAIEQAAVMLVVIADPTAAGAALQALHRLDREGARTLEVGPMDDDALAAIVAFDGVDGDGRAAVVAVANGLPGVARREAAAWAERVASDRLAVDSASSIGATAAAAAARASVFDDVLDLVAARARRDELTSAAWAGRQPYRALAAYQPQDAELFVGRERLVAELAARVIDRRLVAVVGASGSGKSSLVRAGLVPLVRSGRLPGGGTWRATVIVPGADPVAALDEVEGLDEPGPRLLVVDQFEEVLAAGVAEALAARLVGLSADAALDVHVVIVLRADQYPALAALRSLAALVEDAQVLVGPPTEEELRRIVEVPARRTGCTVEPALTALIAEDVAGHDAALPLVSAALAEVWEGRHADTLTVDRYVALGGLAAAVQRMGAKAVERAGEGPIREVMLRLVDVTDDGKWVRRRVLSADIPPDLAPAVDALVDARLVQLGDGRVDVVHEVVFTAWPRLAGWLDEVRAELVLERELRAAARAWDAGGGGDDYLYRGARLAGAAEFVGRRRDVDQRVGAFVAASRQAAERDAEERARHQARVNRRLRTLLTGTVVLLVVAVVAGGLAFRQADRADRSAAEARATAMRADARRVGDRARATAEIDRALLLAVEGMRLDDSPQTRANLLAVLSEHPGLIAPERTRVAGAVATSPRGDRLVTYADDRLALRDAGTLAVLARSEPVPPVRYWSDLEFSPDGRQLAVLRHSHTGFVTGERRTFTDRPVVLHDAGTLAEGPVQLGGFPPLSAAQDVAYSGDGRLLAVSLALFHGPDDAEPHSTPVLVWDLRAPEAPMLRVDPGAVYNNVALSGDGSRLFTAIWPPGGIRAYDTRTGALAAAVDGVGGRMAIAPDGATLAVTGLNDGQVVVLDGATLAERVRLSGRSVTAFGWPVFSHDGARLAAPDWDAGVLYVWDRASGTVVDELVGQTEFVDWVWFGPHDESVHAATDHDTLLAWRLDRDRRFIARVDPPPGLAPAERAVPVGDGVVAYVAGSYGSPQPGGSMQRRDLRSGRVGKVVDLGHGGLGLTSWRADGRRFASTGQDGAVRVWDPRSGALLAERKVAAGAVASVHYTGDGARLVVAEERGTVYALDAETLAPAGPRVDSGYPLLRAFPGPGDDVAMAVPSDPALTALVLVDVDQGRVVRTQDVGFAPSSMAVSPDGGRMAVGGAAGEVRLLDQGTRRWLGPPISAHQGEVSWLAWSADGTAVVGGGIDGRLSLWDTASGALIGTVVPGPPDTALAARFVGRTTTVVAPASDGSIYRWDTDPGSWVRLACAVAGRNLTRAEWRETFGARPYRTTCP